MNEPIDPAGVGDTPRPALPSRLRSSHVRIYSIAEFASEAVIYCMLVASPWLFGTTQTWSVELMDIAGFGLGVLLVVKLFIRHFRDYRPQRWGGGRGERGAGSRGQRAKSEARSAKCEEQRSEVRGQREGADEETKQSNIEHPTSGFGSSDGGGRKSEDGGGERLETKDQGLGSAKSREERVEVRGQRSEVGNRRLEGGAGSEEHRTANAEHRPSNPLTKRKWILTPSLKRVTAGLAILTIAILGYCLISAVNYRSVWDPMTNTFEYHSFVSWLPHSYDQASTWRVFWNYAAMACTFWAIRDWLLGANLSEAQTQRSVRRAEGGQRKETSFLPGRMRRLFWVLSVNGGLLAVEGIAQRLSGTGKLLWITEPLVHKDAASQFGAYAYRSNAAQYFNLLWPAVLGFWWTLHRSGGFRRWRHHWLLVCGALMAACPIISTTRGGALVTGGLIFCAALFLSLSPLFFKSRRGFSPRTALVTAGVLAAFFGVALWLGIHFGWSALEPRMTEIEAGYEQREHMYETARQMARDYPFLGTGPGTFDPLFQLYRASTEEYWPAQLHNDWLETRITFGLIGSALIAAALGLVLVRWFVPGGIHGGRRFVVLIWMGLLGCMVHARFDFPFQVYSILLLFLGLCAVLMTVTRRG